MESPDRIEDHIDAAFVAAGAGRPGPAVLMLPVDLQQQPAGQPALRTARLDSWPIDRPRPAQRLIEEAADVLAAAKAPWRWGRTGHNQALAQAQPDKALVRAPRLSY